MDKQYWDKFYEKEALNRDITKASTFAVFCQVNFLTTPKTIIELGCGNGRDALYFADKGHSVLAIDQCIDQRVNYERSHDNLRYLECDFVNHDLDQPSDVLYSRFTIHSITQQDQDILLPNAYKKLPDQGLFCIEVRTTKDPKCGLGECIAENTYVYDGHTRRFIDSQDFLKTALSVGFKLRYFIERSGLSIYNNDDPVLMRIILKK